LSGLLPAAGIAGWLGRAEDGRVSYSAKASYDLVPGLDGLRAVSILLVMVSHAGFGSIVPGGFGVTVFFFVSGLLITRQLLAELAATRSLALGRFCMRRALRLYPPLIAMVLLGTSLFVLLGGPIRPGQVVAALLYFYNYGPLIFGWGADLATQHGPYDILWSLAVEEHFYLLFPLMLLPFRRGRRHLVLALIGAIVAITVWRCGLAAFCGDSISGVCVGGVPERLESGTDTRVDSILYGALLAALLDGPGGARALRWLKSPGAFGLGVVLVLVSLAYRSPEYRETLRYTLQGVALLLVVGSLLFSEPLAPLRRLLSCPPARLMGRLSYSFYLWHWVVIVIGLLLRFGQVAPYDPAQMAWLHWALVPVAVGSFAVACVSYYGLERPMLRIRRRFGSHSVADGALAYSGEKR
jgi:peptidoglycan/LPS O-acetylase OafA/YrhL